MAVPAQIVDAGRDFQPMSKFEHAGSHALKGGKQHVPCTMGYDWHGISRWDWFMTRDC